MHTLSDVPKPGEVGSNTHLISYMFSRASPWHTRAAERQLSQLNLRLFQQTIENAGDRVIFQMTVASVRDSEVG